jgi:hypothetical protein
MGVGALGQNTLGLPANFDVNRFGQQILAGLNSGDQQQQAAALQQLSQLDQDQLMAVLGRMDPQLMMLLMQALSHSNIMQNEPDQFSPPVGGTNASRGPRAGGACPAPGGSTGPISRSTAGASGTPDLKGFSNLSGEQKQNAQTIIRVGKEMGASNRDIQVALMTAMQESGLRNLNGGDRDSAGLFQQRPSCGWGSKEQVTNPDYAARQFYSHLLRIPNRDSMALTQEAQSVQRSAFPDAYAKWEGLAAGILQQSGAN